MNLAAMTNQVCSKTGQEEPEEVTAARQFLRNRFELVWQSELWLDALAEATLELKPETDGLHQAGLVRMPYVFERLLGVRADDRILVGEAIGMRYRVDQDSFAQQGTSARNAELGSAVATGASPARIRLEGNAGGVDAGAKVQVRFIDEWGERQTAEWTMQAVGQFETAARALRIESVTKTATLGEVRVYWVFEGPTFTHWDGRPLEGVRGRVATLSPGRLEAPRCRWIRLAEQPAKAMTLRVLGKTFAPQWNEAETAPLTGASALLLAFGLGDMEQRGRQFGRANQYFSEAAALLEALKRVEVDQTSARVVLVPEVFDHYNGEGW